MTGLRLVSWLVAAALVTRLAESDELDPVVDLWPLVYYDTHTRRSALEVVYPLFESTREGDIRETFLRPLWRRRTDPEKKLEWRSFLWPLYRSSREGTRFDSAFFPFSFHTSDRSGSASKPWALTVFPVFFGEKTREHGSDFAVFPLFGILHNRFGRDRIRFVLWPIYTSIKQGDRTAYNVIWPLFSYSAIPHGSGWKVWPVYGCRRKKGHYVKRFVLWPLYIAVDAQIEGVGTYRARMYWPFYGWEHSPRGHSQSWFWPFVSHVVDRKDASETWHYFWPLMGRRKAKTKQWSKFLPLFRRKLDLELDDRGAVKRGTQQLVALYPFLWLDRIYGPRYWKYSFKFVPIYTYTQEDWPTLGRHRAYTQLWPLLRWERTQEDADVPVTSQRLTALSLWPWRDISNVDRTYGLLLLQVFDYRREADGSRLVHLLWRLFRHRRTQDRRFTELWPLVALGRGPGAYRFALLKGLFEIRRTPSGQYLQLLYLPRIRLGHAQPAGPERAAKPAINHAPDD